MRKPERLRRLAQAEQRLAREIDAMRRRLDEAGLRGFTLAELKEFVRRNRHKPGDGSLPALVEPPRGPFPRQGGAAAPLEFRED